MMKKLLCLALAGLLLAGTLTACEKTEIQLTETGPDTAKEPDTLTVGEGGDYASLTDALDAVRELRASGDMTQRVIRLADGDWFLEETVVIDEGIPNLTIESNGGARLIGGYRVTDFEWDEFNGVKCLSAPVRNGDFTDFYVNGERASLTRCPTEGFLYTEDIENHGGELGSSSKWFTAAEGDIRDFRNFERIQITFLHYWIDEHTPIESYDPETRRVTMLYPSQFNMNGNSGPAGLEYILENVAETFGRPDDWYYEDGRVYYVPRDESITPETIDAYIPTTAKLFDIHGTAETPVTNVYLRGLSMSVTRGEYNNGSFASDNQSVNGADGTISFRYAMGCTVEDCRLTNYGLYGVNMDLGSHLITVSRCEFWDGGAGGVKIIGVRDESSPDASDHNTVADCSIIHCGRRHTAACGILMLRTGSNVIEHNEIADIFYTGISCGWDWEYRENPTHDNLITKNHIHNIGGPLSDMGGIYLLSPQPGAVISYNLIHDIITNGYGANGLYADYGTSEVIFENNLVYNVSSNAFQQSYGENNLVRNNIFWNSGTETVNVFAYENHLSATLEKNIIVTNGKPIYDLKRDHLSHKTVKSNGNLLWELADGDQISVSLGEGKTWTPEQVGQFFGLDTESVTADPGFADPENGDFTLPENSPALDIGFVPFDLSDVGPRK